MYADSAVRAREHLAACHGSALRVARELGLRSISFPAIGTGIFRYPAREAAEIATLTVISALRTLDGPRLVRFVFAGHVMRDLYADAARRMLTQRRAGDEATPASRLRERALLCE